MTATQNPAPLAGHALFRTRDLDEARERVAAVFCPHRLETQGRQAGFDARHHHLAGQRLSLNYIEYGARTLIAPGELGGFYLLQIPLSGGAEISNGTGRYLSSPTQAAVLNPHLPTRMVWEAGTRQVLVQIARAAMQDHLAAALGGPSDRPLTFEGPLDLTTGPGAALKRLILWLVAETDAGAPPIGPGLMARQIESTVLTGLIEAGGHDHAALMQRHRAAPAPSAAGRGVHSRPSGSADHAGRDRGGGGDQPAWAATGLPRPSRHHAAWLLARGAAGPRPCRSDGGPARHHRHPGCPALGVQPFRPLFRTLPRPLWAEPARHSARRNRTG